MKKVVLSLMLCISTQANAESYQTIRPVSSGGVASNPVGYINSQGNIGSVSAGGVKSQPSVNINSSGSIRSVSSGGVTSSSGRITK